MAWRHFDNALEAVEQLKGQGYEVLAVEQCDGSTKLNEFTGRVLTGEPVLREKVEKEGLKVVYIRHKNCRNSVRNIKYHLSSMTMWISPLP